VPKPEKVKNEIKTIIKNKQIELKGCEDKLDDLEHALAAHRERIEEVKAEISAWEEIQDELKG